MGISSTTNRVTYLGKIYESLQNANVGHTPDTSLTWWLLIGPDNKHAALDNSVSTVSSSVGKLTLVVNKEIPLNHENDFFLSKSIPTDVEDQELKQSADLIMERVLKALRG